MVFGVNRYAWHALTLSLGDSGAFFMSDYFLLPPAE